MSQVDRIGKPRFSRRQVTKRTFNIGSGFEKKSDSTKKQRTDSARKEKVDSVRKEKTVTPNKEKRPQKTVQSYFVTPPGPQNISTIADVSVSFLSSTPKPGKTQLSRKRPLSAVHESKISKTSAHKETSNPRRKSPTSSSTINTEHRETSNPRRKSPTSNSTTNQQQSYNSIGSKKRSLPEYQQEESNSIGSNTRSKTGSLVQDNNSDVSNDRSKTGNRSKASSSSQSSYSKQENERPISKSSSKGKGKTITKTSTPLRSSGSDLITEQSEGLVNRTSQQRKRKHKEMGLSEKVYEFDDRTSVESDSQSTPIKQRLEKKSFFTSTRTDITPTVSKKKVKASTAVTSVRVSGQSTSKQSQNMTSVKDRNVTPARQQTVNDTASSKEITSDDDVDISVKNKENNPIKKKMPAKTSKTVKNKQTPTDTIEEEEEIPVRKVMVLQDGRTRKRSDMLDLDVALTSLTEAIQSQAGTCETQKEQSAIRLLEKYLVQDITKKISDMQNVKKLQDKIRKSTQTVKERKKHLMSLQREKSLLLMEKGDIENKRQSADNMKVINNFLGDMKQLISQS